MRLESVSPETTLYGFQFTHPGKGATTSVMIMRVQTRCFNSRTLGRVRHPTGSTTACRGRSFNSRTLGRVRPDCKSTAPFCQLVSIHAPWEGCDGLVAKMMLTEIQFQFTHPGKGATRKFYFFSWIKFTFQFTHPGKGATVSGRAVRLVGLVSIHAPWEGCDWRDHQHDSQIPRVSIHAPWEGCDTKERHLFASTTRFQFTHPGKGATKVLLFLLD